MNQMSVATFDTLAAVRNLEKAGMGTSQAEAVTETIRIAVFQGVATKEDIGELRSDVKADIAELRSEIGGLRAEMKDEIDGLRVEMKDEIGGLRVEMKAETGGLRVDLEKLRADLTWRMVLIMGTMIGLFTALDRLFLN